MSDQEIKAIVWTSIFAIALILVVIIVIGVF